MMQQESEGGHAVLKNLKTLTTAKLYHKLSEINEISARLDKEEGNYYQLNIKSSHYAAVWIA